MVRLGPIALVVALAAAGAAGQVYEIGVGDVVSIGVLGQDAMSGDFEVDTEGMIDFPILGPVKASGFTTEEFQRKLTTLLADGYVKRPTVSIEVAESRRQRVYVAGRIAKPGAYALPADHSLLSLVRQVGTLADDVAHEVVVVRPPDPAVGSPPEVESPRVAEAPGDENPDEDSVTDDEAEEGPPRAIWYRIPNEQPGSEVFHVNLTELLSGNPDRNLALAAGDTVFFPPAANIYVTGHVSRPGPLRFREGLTVFHALTLAGGLTDRGSKKIKIIRILGGEQVEVDAEMTDLVRPEDTIVVPERFF